MGKGKREKLGGGCTYPFSERIEVVDGVTLCVDFSADDWDYGFCDTVGVVGKSSICEESS